MELVEKWINFAMDAETNELLTDASARSRRAKRKEAQIRLKDHLMRFQSISELGEAKIRSIKEEK